jgi:hypothetical protein
MVDIELDLTDINETDLEQDGRLPVGRYHVQFVSAARDPNSQLPCLRLKYTVLAGTDSSAVGMAAEERLYFSEKAKKRAAIFANRLGLIDSSAFGKRSSLDWSAVVGQQAVVEVIEETYEKKDGSKGISSKISFAGIWSTDDERTKDVPRGKELPRNGAPRAAAGTATAKLKKAAADDLSDL